MLSEIAELDREALLVADRLGSRAHDTTLRSVENTIIGGSVWRQLTRHARQRRVAARAEAELSQLETTVRMVAAGTATGDDESTVMFMADRLSSASGDEQVAEVRRLLDLVGRKKALVERLERDVQLHALMVIWLYIHVPLSVALLGVLMVHVLSVFFYW